MCRNTHSLCRKHTPLIYTYVYTVILRPDNWIRFYQWHIAEFITACMYNQVDIISYRLPLVSYGIILKGLCILSNRGYTSTVMYILKLYGLDTNSDVIMSCILSSIHDKYNRTRCVIDALLKLPCVRKFSALKCSVKTDNYNAFCQILYSVLADRVDINDNRMLNVFYVAISHRRMDMIKLLTSRGISIDKPHYNFGLRIAKNCWKNDAYTKGTSHARENVYVYEIFDYLSRVHGRYVRMREAIPKSEMGY